MKSREVQNDDLHKISYTPIQSDLDEVASALNDRPRKTLATKHQLR